MVHIVTDTGRWVNENFARLAEIVEDYDPQFELRFIPPEHRFEPGDREKCWVVWDLVGNYPVLFAGEEDTPLTILERLFDADNKHGNVLKRLEAHNAALEAIKMKEDLDKREEQQEKVAWLIGTKQNYINLGNGRVVDDQLRRIR